MYAEHNVVTEKISTLKYITDIYEITALLIAKAGPPSTDIRFIKNLGWRKEEPTYLKIKTKNSRFITHQEIPKTVVIKQ